METPTKKGNNTKTSVNQREENKSSSNVALKQKEISVGTADIEDEIQLERREAYVEAETQKLLRELLSNEAREEIVPQYDPANGFVYKLVEPLLEETTDNKNVPDFLERLTRLDILNKSFYESISTCPSCYSSNLSLHASCRKCRSHNIRKTSLTEHIPCGYIGEREKYMHNTCPKCGRSLDETPYTDMGRWYVCRACGEKFEHPIFDIVCRNCENIFQTEEADLKEISKYTLNPQRKKEVRQNVASLDSISNLLTELGFEIQMPGLATGEKSGMRHQFSLLARKETEGRQNLIALDMVVAESEIQASPLILYIYKTSEVTVDIPIFVAFPKFSDTAQKIAQGHNILLIEGSPDEPRNVAKIKMEIQDRLSRKPSAQTDTNTQTENNIAASINPQRIQKLFSQNSQKEEEKEKKSQAQLFSVTSTIHPESKKTRGFMKYLKKNKTEEEQ